MCRVNRTSQACWTDTWSCATAAWPSNPDSLRSLSRRRLLNRTLRGQQHRRYPKSLHSARDFRSSVEQDREPVRIWILLCSYRPRRRLRLAIRRHRHRHRPCKRPLCKCPISRQFLLERPSLKPSLPRRFLPTPFTLKCFLLQPPLLKCLAATCLFPGYLLLPLQKRPIEKKIDKTLAGPGRVQKRDGKPLRNQLHPRHYCL